MSAFELPAPLESSMAALEQDLLREDGPHISSVRNYNFAILPYPPEDEFALRRAIQRLAERLRDAGWNLETIALHALMLDRVRREGDELVESIISRERHLVGSGAPERALNTLKDRVCHLIEGPEGLAKDVVREVERIVGESSSAVNRTVIFLGRAGALYPFLRTSALLKHVAGHTHNVPVVLLYPGKVVGETGLSFMGELPADRDYRPRIYR